MAKSSNLHGLPHHQRSKALLFSSFPGYFNASSDNNKSSPSGSDTCVLSQHINSTTDEDHQIIQNRKQRRMLSNRESARRSRLRKQQHLDELRAQVAHLRAQNSQILTSLSLASKQYAELAEENRNLCSEASNLSNRLQSLLNIAMSSHCSNYIELQATQTPLISFQKPKDSMYTRSFPLWEGDPLFFTSR